MQLIFNSLAELDAMIHAMGYAKRDTVNVDIRVDAKELIEAAEQAADRIAEHAEKNSTEGAPPAEESAIVTVASYGPQHGTEPEAPTKRKRRTKAEIEADKAAQVAAGVESPAGLPNHGLAVDGSMSQREVGQPNPLDNLKSEADAKVQAVTDNVDALQAITEMAGLYDGSDELAHLNEGREFIAKHGFPTYNETLALAGVPANIAAHTPEQVARHRAAMAYTASKK